MLDDTDQAAAALYVATLEGERHQEVCACVLPKTNWVLEWYKAGIIACIPLSRPKRKLRRRTSKAIRRWPASPYGHCKMQWEQQAP